MTLTDQIPEIPKPYDQESFNRVLAQTQQAVLEAMPELDHYVETARAILGQDIADPDLEPVSESLPDVFTLRANQVGIALLQRRAYGYAAQLYEALLDTADQYTKATQQTRHLGVLKANLGIAQILAGDVDAGVSLLLETASQDDVQTYRIDAPQSYAVQLLRELVLDQVLTFIVGLCGDSFNLATGNSLGPEAVSTVANHTDPLGEVTLVSLIPIVRHRKWQQRMSTQYGRVRAMDGLRWLSAMLENLVVTIGRCSLDPHTGQRFANASWLQLWNAYGILFGRRNLQWWTAAERDVARASIERSDPDQVVLQRCQDLLNMPESTPDELMTKVVLLSRLTRNFAAHYLEISETVLNRVYMELVQYQILAQLLIFDWAYQNGHFTQLAPPGVWPQ